jgi:hypothetical protein
VFDRYDTDGSGALSKPEVKAMFKELGYQIESAELNAIMAEVGGTDKLIQYDEFEQMIRIFIREREAGIKSHTPHPAAEPATPSAAKLRTRTIRMKSLRRRAAAAASAVGDTGAAAPLMPDAAGVGSLNAVGGDGGPGRVAAAGHHCAWGQRCAPPPRPSLPRPCLQGHSGMSAPLLASVVDSAASPPRAGVAAASEPPGLRKLALAKAISDSEWRWG